MREAIINRGNPNIDHARAAIREFLGWSAPDEEKFGDDVRIILFAADEIEREFGDALEWQDLPGRSGCRIRKLVSGGYRSSPDEWPHLNRTLVDAMVRLHGAFGEV